MVAIKGVSKPKRNCGDAGTWEKPLAMVDGAPRTAQTLEKLGSLLSLNKAISV
jgi:hypothetical protein